MIEDADVWQQERELAEWYEAQEVAAEMARCPECEAHIGSAKKCEWCEWEKA